MATAYGALCTDFYVNQKLSLKLDLPSGRETVLGLFDRIRKERPSMNQLKRFEGELALESQDDAVYDWMALRKTSIRSGSVNPESIENASKLHRTILRVSPYFLTISPLDIDYLELVFGFDFEVEANRNELIYDALLGDSPITRLVDRDNETLLDCQPLISFKLDEARNIEAQIDIKTRVRSGELKSGQYESGPITVSCAVRHNGAIKSIDDLPKLADILIGHLINLTDDRVLPHVIAPVREIISSRPS